MNRDLQDRSSLADGLDWAARITSIGLEFVLPGLLGAGVDHWLGTRPLATIGGAILGFCVGMLHLLKIASQASDRPRPRPPRPPG